MFGFGEVFNRKPRQFNYRPRYYDPEKEARERRRAELGLEPTVQTEPKPGDRLRGRKIMHEEEFAIDSRRRRKRTAVLATVILVLLALTFWLIMSIEF